MLPFEDPIKPMKARTRVNPPEPPGWVYEPKWDGFRMVAWGGAELRLESRNGKDLLRYFPELTDALEELPQGTVLDGEVVVVRNGVTDFDALQMRIHPAESRINMLAEETPATLIVFDGGNNRVLVWNTWPAMNGQAADVVLGQGNFVNDGINDDNQDGMNDGVPSARTLATAGGQVHSYVRLSGTRLFVGDRGNSRILIFNGN